MFEHEGDLEALDPNDTWRRAIFFGVGRDLVRTPWPDGGLYFDEERFAHIALKPEFEEVWRDFQEIYHELQTVNSAPDIQKILRDAKERPGVRVEVGADEGAELVPGRIIAVIGYHPDFPDAIAGIAVTISDDGMVPVTIWPRDKKVEVYESAID